MALLELDGVAAGYVEGIDILNGLTLGVERGTVTGIIGPNGAGKSTLLKTIFGFLHPRSGRIVFDGHDVAHLPPHAMKRRGIGYVPQAANVFARKPQACFRKRGHSTPPSARLSMRARSS